MFEDSREGRQGFRACNGESNVLDGLENNPVVVVGFAFRFPGDAIDSTSFWNMMMEQRCAMTSTPADRISENSWYHPDQTRRGQFYTRGAHYLQEDISFFDAPFFSLSAEEAAGMDPQQRHLLEVTYHALENSGIPLHIAVGSHTSVHVGCFTNDYGLQIFKDIETSADYDVFGVNTSMNANRVSWFYDFKGASMNVDTACSSSLVALDLACQELRIANSNMGIVAGTNLIFSPDFMQILSNVNMLSPDGKSYSFDQRANGYGRGEGTGAIVIKRLDDALRDGDTIRAVIRSTGQNQDGRTPLGIMQPSSDAQSQLILNTYAKSSLNLEPTRYFEAHGTGTPVGDPIEVNALGEVFRSVRTVNDPLYVGSVKSNIGHLEGASGIASVIKTILILEKGIIPPCANLEKINAKIDTEWLRIKFALTPTPWPTAGLRRASINSFGFGGSNAHIVLDDAFHFFQQHGLSGNHVTAEYPPSTTIPRANGIGVHDIQHELPMPKLFVVSAHDKSGVKRVASTYSNFLGQLPNNPNSFSTFVADLSHTLNTRRSALPYRSFWIASNRDQLLQVEKHIVPVQQAVDKPVLGFVFTGQGAQWAGMGRELLIYSAFKDSLTRSNNFLKELGSKWSLEEEICRSKDSSLINTPEIAQPATTALQIALVDLLRSIGVQPAAVIGHSSGEIAAAYTKGALSATEAIRIAFFRGVCAAKLSHTQRRAGAMISVGLAEDDVAIYIKQIAQEHGHCGLDIACINSQKNVTVSGDEQQIDALREILDSKQIFARKLAVPVAYHSFHMEDISASYRELIGPLDSCPPVPCSSHTVLMISSVTGQQVETKDMRLPEYWVKNLTSPVRFSTAFNQICTKSGKVRKKLDSSHLSQIGVNFILEVGPHSGLQAPIRNLLELLPWSRGLAYSSLLRRGKHAAETFLTSIGHLYCFGVLVDFVSVNKLGESCSKTHAKVVHNLPGYPFNHQTSYWHESRIASQLRLENHTKLDLLGKPALDWNPLEPRWRNIIHASQLPWIQDHVINGVVMYPAAGMVVMAIEAANQMADPNRKVTGFQLKNISFLRALLIPTVESGVETHLQLSQETSSWTKFRLSSFDNGRWHEHCRGLVKVEYETNNQNKLDRILKQRNEIAERCELDVDHDQLYQRASDSGLVFGSTFRTTHNGKFSKNGEAIASVSLYKWNMYPQPHVVHPTTLDGIFHLVLAILSEGGQKQIPTAVPSGIRRFWIANDGLGTQCDDSDVTAFASMKSINNRGHECDIRALNKAGTAVLAQIDGLQSTIVITKSADQTHRHTLYHLDTVPDIEMLNPTQLSSYCAQVEHGPDPLDYHLDLNFVLYKFLDRTIHASGGDIDEQKIALHVLRYTEWARHQLNQYQQGQLPLSRDEWKDKDDAYFNSACERVAAANSQGFMFVHTGKTLLSILRGEQDPLQFLFKDDYIHAYYRETNNRPCFDQWHRYLKLYAAKHPKMRILEIGAGTGATTSQALHTLSHGCGHSEANPAYLSYDFTDISPIFLQRAQEKYNNYPRIKYQVLNIENDPLQQGYTAESYDLIIAANVLHATPNMSHTMENVRKLLKPNGKLMLYEITRPDIVRSGFIGGLMAGWWAGMEDGRQWSPAMTTTQWADVLIHTGFSGVDLEIPEYVDSDCQETSILLSTAVSVSNPTQERRLDEQFTNIKFVVDPGSVFQKDLFEQVRGLIASQYPGSVVEKVSWEDSASLPSIKNSTLVFLLETDATFFSQISEENLTRLQEVIHQCGHVLWVTAGGGAAPKNPEHCMATGWVRTLSNERTMGRMCALSLDINGPVRGEQVEYIVQVLAEEVFNKDKEHHESEFIEVDGSLHISVLRPNVPLSEDISAAEAEELLTVKPIGDAGAVKLQTRESGSLGSFQWVEDNTIIEPLQADEVEIDVRAVGVNGHDFLVALGKVPGELGLESSGVVTRVGSASIFKPGDRVITFGQGLFRTTMRSRDDQVCNAPASLSFTESASIPIHFGTAWQAINEIAGLHRGDRILIHATPGGIWLAAVKISQDLGAELLITVDSDEQKSVVQAQSEIAEDHVILRGNADFTDLIMSITQGDGVDVLLINSSDGEDVFVASCECMAPDGRIVEIGGKASRKLLSIAMPNTTNISYTHFNSIDWMRRRPTRAKKAIDTVIDLVEQRSLQLQPLHSFSVDQVEEAFRAANAETTINKVVIDLTSNASVPVLLTKKKFECTFHADATYIITGGFGGLGRVIARWMVQLGARNLVLLGRSGAKTKQAQELMQELESQNVRVAAPPCDIIDPVAVRRVFQELAETMPPIKGCIHGTLVLRDRLFNDLTYEDWRIAAECRAAGSWNLETNLPRNLDFFVMLSSASGVVGLPSQSNYAAGNTYMDALARYRVRNGQKAISIDLGAMNEDGILVETGILDKVLSYGPMAPVSRKALLALLDHYCNRDLPILSPSTSQILIGLTVSGEGYMGKLFARKRLFSRPEVSEHNEQDVNGTPRIDARKALVTATSLQEARDIVSQALISRLTYDYRVIAEDLDVDLQAPLYTFGVDSLLAVELCKWVANEFSAEVATFEVLGGGSVTTMSTMVATRSQLQHPTW